MALIITKGFKDLLHIGNQARPKIFDLVSFSEKIWFSCISSAEEKSRKKSIVKWIEHIQVMVFGYTISISNFLIFIEIICLLSHQTQTNTVYHIGRSKAIFISAPVNVYSSLEIQSTSGIYAIEHGFLRVLQFLPSIKLAAMIYLKYCWKWRLK